MGKRLMCPSCRAANEYDVPANEPTATLRDVRCRACNHSFPYGFKSEYVTEREPDETRDPTTSDFGDIASLAHGAHDRLARYVDKYTDYHDRDRDILLLHLVEMMQRLDERLSSLHRKLDVLIVRQRVNASTLISR